ncbi:hypothetical protein RHSIM_Rhsim13G0159600 [Rhododendron simsii]|uniref:Uncharacterized protein n=1 Tax=Rhododendron simsii TaxID=118357 RepID=A0A834FXC3_RHOSS|nr:hypothetical protein RHSIM_Rhsim13G0159600 [Rhododendron simsii]
MLPPTTAAQRTSRDRATARWVSALGGCIGFMCTWNLDFGIRVLESNGANAVIDGVPQPRLDFVDGGIDGVIALVLRHVDENLGDVAGAEDFVDLGKLFGLVGAEVGDEKAGGGAAPGLRNLQAVQEEVEYRDPLGRGALCDCSFGSINDAVMTCGGGEVPAAEEEAVDDVRWAASGAEVVKAIGCVVGVGGENGEEGVEVCVVGAVWGVGTGCVKGCVWAV